MTKAKTSSDKSPTSFTGGCLCGSVRFEINAAFDDFHLCHCQQCQQTTGSAHAANLMTSPTALRWLQGEDAVCRYDVPGRTISNAFCQRCGSALPFVSVSGARTIVPAGSLDKTPPIPPRRHIFWNERASWYANGDALPTDHNFGADG